jgi:hypothetical protein
MVNWNEFRNYAISRNKKKHTVQRRFVERIQVSGTAPLEDITIFTARVRTQNSIVVVVVVVGKFLW